MHTIIPRTGLLVFSPAEAADVMAKYPGVDSLLLAVSGVLDSKQDVLRMRKRVRNLATRRGVGSLSTMLADRQDRIDRTVFVVRRCARPRRFTSTQQARIFLLVHNRGMTRAQVAREFRTSPSVVTRLVNRFSSHPS